MMNSTWYVCLTIPLGALQIASLLALHHLSKSQIVSCFTWVCSVLRSHLRAKRSASFQVKDTRNKQKTLSFKLQSEDKGIKETGQKRGGLGVI